jgi:membrane protein required for colicin V production
MNALDWVLSCTGILCMCRGIWRGAVSQVFGIVGILGGFLTAAYFYQDVTLRLAQSFGPHKANPCISFIILYFLAWFCIVMAGLLVAKLLHSSGLGLFDRSMGALFGISKALLLAVVLIAILTFFLPPQNDLLSRSLSVPYIQGISKILVSTTPQSMQRLFDRKLMELEKYLPAAKQITRESGAEQR